ncbi:MAG TPA: hypothetical protein VIX84_09420 [Acidimicrobiales bacterium]
MAFRRRRRGDAGCRSGRWWGASFAGAVALCTALLAAPAPAQAGLFGAGRTSEYTISAPGGALPFIDAQP